MVRPVRTQDVVAVSQSKSKINSPYLLKCVFKKIVPDCVAEFFFFGGFFFFLGSEIVDGTKVALCN